MQIHDFDFIFNLSKTDVAGVLTACGYAIREQTTLFSALGEMGFDIDTTNVEDIICDRQLTSLAISCLSRIYKKQRNQIQIGERVSHPDLKYGVIKVIDFTPYLGECDPNNPWLEIEFLPNKRAIGRLKTLKFLGWEIGES